MAFEITINDTLILDQTAGLQDGDDPLAADLLALAAPFRTALFALAGSQVLSAGQLAYAASVKGAFSGAGYVTVNPDGGTVDNLFFSDPDGNLFDGDKVVFEGNDLKTIDGDSIYLYSLGDGDIVIATTSPTAGLGKVVAAFYLDDLAGNLSASIQMVTFIALDHPDDTDPDDRVDWTDLLNVAATGSLSFEFDTLESGKFLWVAVGDNNNGLLVTGKSLNVDASGNRVSGGQSPSDAMNTSQGGQGATIGIDSQMFVPGETAVFTLVTGFDPLGSGPDATGDNANEIDYDGFLNTNGAGVFISQKQGNTLLDLTIKVYEAGGGTTPETGLDYIGTEPSGAFNDDTAVPVKTVTVLNAAGNPVATWAVAPGAGQVASGTTVAGVKVTITGNNIEVDGVDALYTVNWTVNDGDTFNRFQVGSDFGKFDIGRIDVSKGLTEVTPVGDSLFVDDDGPSVDLVIKSGVDLTVDESSLGLPIPVNPTDSITAGDLFTITESFGTDGAGASGGVYKLVLGADTTSGLFDTDTNLEVILSIDATETLISGKVNDGGLVDVFTIAIDPVTGTVTLTQYRALKNGDPTDPDESDTPLTLALGTVSVQKTLTDKDDDAASDTVDISSIFKFEDDGPSQNEPSEAIDNFVTDDSSITDTDDDETTDNIFPDAPDFGADGPRATNPIVISLQVVDLTPLDGKDPDSGLIDTETGKSIRLVKESGDIVGYVDISGDGVLQAGEKIVDNEAIRYSLDPVVGDPGNFTVTFTQSRAIYHDKLSADTEETLAANTVFVQREAFDGDGDPAETKSVDLGAITFIEDDDPAIGPIADGLVNFASGASVQKTLSGLVGNDPNLVPYTLTAYTDNLTINGVLLQAVPVGDDEVGYWADTNNDTIFGNGGDTLYYKMKLGAQDGAGNYTFSVFVDPPPAVTEFNFDDLPSGSNLFGIVGDADAGLVIFGKTIGLKDDNTYISNQTQEVKTSQAGLHDTIGIESQMFDPGDAAYFTFVTNPDPNFTGTALGSTEADDADNILYGATLEGTSAFIKIAQTQGGGSTRKMSIELFNIDDDDPQGVAMINARGQNEAGKDPDVIAVRVYAADGTTLLESFSGGVEANMTNAITIEIVNGVATVQGFNTNYKIEWDADEVFDQTLITGVSGKWDVGGFGFVQANDTPDQFLTFTAQVTDGDGDTASDSWNIGIDGTGINDDDHVDNVVAVI